MWQVGNIPIHCFQSVFVCGCVRVGERGRERRRGRERERERGRGREREREVSKCEYQILVEVLNILTGGCKQQYSTCTDPAVRKAFALIYLQRTLCKLNVLLD